MGHLLQRYCEQTSVHGVCDLFYARSSFTKIFWTTVLIFGIAMTGYQMYSLVDHYRNNPIRTEIATLSPNTNPKYPPYLFGTTYFSQWIDLKKIIAMNFDLDTFYYFMSYFYPIYTRRWFNVTKAEQMLTKIMQEKNIPDLYDLAIMVADKSPKRLLSNDTFHRFVSQNGEFVYIVKPKYYTSETFMKYSRHEIYLKSFASFEYTQFYKDFLQLYNYSLKEDYALYVGKSDPNLIDSNVQIFSPILMNVVGNQNTYIPVDVYSNDYDFFLHGTLYNWVPSSDRPCRINNEGNEKYYVECRMHCAGQFKFYNVHSCRIYFITEHADFDNLTQSCRFNATLLRGAYTHYPNDSYNSCLRDCMSSCKEWHFQFQEVSYPRRNIQDQSSVVYGKISLTYQQNDSILVVSLLPAATWNEALSGIGGLLGLWLGGSIISFIQLIYIFLCVPLEAWFINLYNNSVRKKSVFIKPAENLSNGNISTAAEKYTKTVPSVFSHLDSIWVKKDIITDGKKNDMGIDGPVKTAQKNETSQFSFQEQVDSLKTEMREQVDSLKFELNEMKKMIINIAKN